MNNDNCCIAKILKVIEVLQNNACCSDLCEEGCDRPILGPVNNLLCYNTRPVTLYTRNGTLFTANYINSEGVESTSTVFRVENVNNCCAKLRVLEDNDGTITATNNFVTVNLKCMCACSCLDDLALANVC